MRFRLTVVVVAVLGIALAYAPLAAVALVLALPMASVGDTGWYADVYYRALDAAIIFIPLVGGALAALTIWRRGRRGQRL